MVALDAGSALAVHTLFEMGGVFTGMRLYAVNMRGHALGSIARGSSYAVALGCIAGAIAGSKLAVWIDRPDLALALAASPRLWLMGQSIVGALVGGLCGVEIAKRWNGVRVSTGDAFVVPLAAGIVIGRIGCFLAGLHDDTFGNATTLPWGVDFGDGIARHPTQLYDMLFVVALALMLRSLRRRLAQVPGLAFKLFFCGYLAWRFAIDFTKPVHDPYPGGLSGLQVIAAGALLAYLPFVVRALRRLR
ncbi:MAG TPA: prolipoprotein diacylglyceryl transferase family protein [Casimicrobiaceae bacterium]|nr:prolipoprotein diacylglyceryl transferase family protein [Casimicrobiaceae bacterium]